MSKNKTSEERWYFLSKWGAPLIGGGLGYLFLNLIRMWEGTGIMYLFKLILPGLLFSLVPIGIWIEFVRKSGRKSFRYNPIGFGSKTFLIYKTSTGLTEAIKVGWSWPAFFFHTFWLLYKKIYVWAACTLILWLIMFGLSQSILPEISFDSFSIVFYILFGVGGNELYIHTLEKKGYKFTLSVNADNPQNAKAQFVEYMKNTN